MAQLVKKSAGFSLYQLNNIVSVSAGMVRRVPRGPLYRSCCQSTDSKRERERVQHECLTHTTFHTQLHNKLQLKAPTVLPAKHTDGREKCTSKKKFLLFGLSQIELLKQQMWKKGSYLLRLTY